MRAEKKEVYTGKNVLIDKLLILYEWHDTESGQNLSPKSKKKTQEVKWRSDETAEGTNEGDFETEEMTDHNDQYEDLRLGDEEENSDEGEEAIKDEESPEAQERNESEDEELLSEEGGKSKKPVSLYQINQSMVNFPGWRGGCFFTVIFPRNTKAASV